MYKYKNKEKEIYIVAYFRENVKMKYLLEREEKKQECAGGERGLSAVKTKKNETATAPSRFFLKRRRKTERLAGA